MIDELIQINILIRKSFAYLSQYPLPLGLSLGPFLHIIVGIVWTGFFHFLGKSKISMFFGIFLIALLKEFYDSFTLENRIEDHIVDVLLTIAPSIVWILYWRLKSKRTF